MRRREFGKIAGAALTAPVLFAQKTLEDHLSQKLAEGSQAAPLQIGMLLYPGLTLLDLIGPQTALAPFSKIHLVWKTREPIASDSGIHIQPTATFDDCPADLDVLFSPGGNHMNALNEEQALRFMADRGARAKWVTSVCSGSVVLGAAGLLRGYRATSHWAVRDALPWFGAEPVVSRVVTDRNRVTGGGVTAGLDFGLVLLAKLRGDDVAKMIQLALEYDPHPPFDTGTPDKAGAELSQRVLKALEPIHEATRQFALRQQGAKA